VIAQKAMVVVLAGGAGRRIGGNKPLYVFEDRPLIEWVIDALKPQASHIFVNAGSQNTDLAGALAELGTDLCFDPPQFERLGPLSGIYTALLTAQGQGEDVVITAPCDMPKLPSNMTGSLLERHAKNIDVTYFRGARDYPLCAAWSTDLLPALEGALLKSRRSGGLAVMQFLTTCRTCKILVDDDGAFFNLNEPITAARVL
jgi:molybdenum cofactor guanylyltransferase